MPFQQSACTRCGADLATAEDALCGRCQRHPPHFDRTVSLFRYEEPARHLILGLKFHRRYAYGRLLGTLVAENLIRCRADLPERIVPVPLHPERFRQRGFNHAAEIAREVARHLGVPMDAEMARRTRETRPQVGLPAEERLRNVRDAFWVKAPCPLRHVAILDDVVTTGATVNELAGLLKRCGVARVDVWTCARADRASPAA